MCYWIRSEIWHRVDEWLLSTSWLTVKCSLCGCTFILICTYRSLCMIGYRVVDSRWRCVWLKCDDVCSELLVWHGVWRPLLLLQVCREFDLSSTSQLNDDDNETRNCCSCWQSQRNSWDMMFNHSLSAVTLSFEHLTSSSSTTFRRLPIFPEISGKFLEILNFRIICNPSLKTGGAWGLVSVSSRHVNSGAIVLLWMSAN